MTVAARLLIVGSTLILAAIIVGSVTDYVYELVWLADRQHWLALGIIVLLLVVLTGLILFSNLRWAHRAGLWSAGRTSDVSGGTAATVPTVSLAAASIRAIAAVGATAFMLLVAVYCILLFVVSWDFSKGFETLLGTPAAEAVRLECGTQTTPAPGVTPTPYPTLVSLVLTIRAENHARSDCAATP